MEQLKKHGIQLEDHALHKEGPWGQVCLTLGIQNNQNNRYRICDAFRQVSSFHLFLKKIYCIKLFS